MQCQWLYISDKMLFMAYAKNYPTRYLSTKVSYLLNKTKSSFLFLVDIFNVMNSLNFKIEIDNLSQNVIHCLDSYNYSACVGVQ